LTPNGGGNAFHAASMFSQQSSRTIIGWECFVRSKQEYSIIFVDTERRTFIEAAEVDDDDVLSSAMAAVVIHDGRCNIMVNTTRNNIDRIATRNTIVVALYLTTSMVGVGWNSGQEMKKMKV
jgi:hypothetical protein